MPLGGRSVRRVLAAPLDAGHYRALARLPVVVDRPVDTLRRYLLGSGRYPHDITVRTPTGRILIRTFNAADVRTVNEIFCREDYRVGTDARVVLDIGANIGVSSLYWLSRNPTARVWLHEPVPTNLERLEVNLRGFGDRVTVRPTAVGVEDGPVEFHVEPTGRYGGIEAKTDTAITVDCVEINRAVEAVLDEAGDIDVLKVDIEGFEFKTLNRLRPDLARRIGAIYFETPRERELLRDDFESSFRGGVQRLQRRGQKLQ